MSSVEVMREARDYFGAIPKSDSRDADETLRLYNLLDAAIKAAQPSAISDERKLWLWKNFVDGRPEYWAFDNPYPIQLNSDDPQTLGEPCGYAIFKPSRAGHAESDEKVITAIKRAQSRQAESSREGWVSVPREPTPEMWDAAWKSIGLPYRAKLSMHDIKTLFDKFHTAMLAAAPKEAK